ncbi:hypothetical protein M4I32_06425 [Microbacterium sp. LRZ72]|uniref:hypothetical protein n=1 Tax=Microbacterium sp. LRZ72 TaxID=2942481 RepID=UPI0029A36D3B|nr:hypothetical protein [Microbacterium sp. LRZ72]MDX2376432.1 hypothetical protein [Microbacterium sp. LRZ72]
MSASPQPPAPDDTEVLRERIAALEAENARLAERAASSPGDDGSGPPRRSRRDGWRAFVSAVCLILAAVMVPVSIAGSWVRAELVDTDRFVATFAPLVDDPAVQSLVIDEATGAIREQLDIDAVTNDLFDGLETLDLPPRALTALDLLREPAVQGVESIITEAVTRVVVSDVFSDAWAAALQASHRGLVAAATGGDEGAVVIGDDGTIGLQLAPIIAEVKDGLQQRGVGFAAMIPEVDTTIELAQSDTLVTVRTVYGLAVTVGWWLPFLALALLGAGVLVARRRTSALIGAGAAVFFGGATLALGLAVGGTVIGLAAAEAGVPGPALAAIYEQVIASMRQTAVVITVIGLVVAVLAWTQGRSRGAVAVRRTGRALTDPVRGALVSRGVDTGSFGRWVDSQRVVVRAGIAALAVLWLWLWRPLEVSDVIVVLVVALAAWWVSEVVRPASAVAVERA